jgi:hypothetical protein
MVFCSVSCHSKQNPLFDEMMIQVISEDQEIPPYSSCLFFVQGENDMILLLDPRELKEIYHEDYSSWDYKEFIRKALNQQIIFKTRKGKPFELNKDVKDNYLNNDFISFMNIYCEKGLVRKDKYVLRNDLPEEWMFSTSVFYFAFINNYLTVFDDFLGRDYISPTSVYYKNPGG